MNIAHIQLPNITSDPVSIIGNPNLLSRPLTALFCSVKCPGELILKTYDLALEWRKQQKAIISGFHSPMEQECLRILLHGTQPKIVCPARSLPKRLPPEWRRPIREGHLLIISKFSGSVKRATLKTALERNWFVGALAEKLFVSYAEPDGKMEHLCQEWLDRQKTVITFDSKYTKNLLCLGAQVLRGSSNLI